MKCAYLEGLFVFWSSTDYWSTVLYGFHVFVHLCTSGIVRQCLSPGWGSDRFTVRYKGFSLPKLGRQSTTLLECGGHSCRTVGIQPWGVYANTDILVNAIAVINKVIFFCSRSLWGREGIRLDASLALSTSSYWPRMDLFSPSSSPCVDGNFIIQDTMTSIINLGFLKGEIKQCRDCLH